MHNLKAIREHLAVTQQALADGLGCTQANISLCERGQMLLPSAGQRLIDYAKSRGLKITFDHVYGSAALPAAEPSLAKEGV